MGKQEFLKLEKYKKSNDFGLFEVKSELDEVFKKIENLNSENVIGAFAEFENGGIRDYLENRIHEFDERVCEEIIKKFELSEIHDTRKNPIINIPEEDEVNVLNYNQFLENNESLQNLKAEFKKEFEKWIENYEKLIKVKKDLKGKLNSEKREILEKYDDEFDFQSGLKNTKQEKIDSLEKLEKRIEELESLNPKLNILGMKNEDENNVLSGKVPEAQVIKPEINKENERER